MILFVYGQDSFRVQEKTGELIDQFRSKRDSVGLNIVKLLGDELSFDQFRQEVMTQGFLSSKKMVVVDRLLELGSMELLEKVHEFVRHFVKKKDDQNVILFIEHTIKQGKAKTKNQSKKLFDFLRKQQFTFQFSELKGVHLEQWIRDRVKQLGGSFDQSVPLMLASRVGSDLWRLSNELSKLVGFKQQEVITREDVEAHTGGVCEENIFALTDAIAAQDKTCALRLLTKELDYDTNELYVLSMIIRQYRILLRLHELIGRGETNTKKIAADLKLHPFVVQKSLPLARKYTFERLKRNYAHLLFVDEHLKTNFSNPQLLLDLFIVN